MHLSPFKNDTFNIFSWQKEAFASVAQPGVAVVVA